MLCRSEAFLRSVQMPLSERITTKPAHSPLTLTLELERKVNFSVEWVGKEGVKRGHGFARGMGVASSSCFPAIGFREVGCAPFSG